MATVAILTPETQGAAFWRVKIDYLSATTGELHVPLPISDKNGRTYTASGEAACRAACLSSLSDDRASLWEDRGGRSGYAVSSAHPVGARVFFDHDVAPPLIELPGAACDLVQDAGELMPFISRNVEGITRLDLAADLETTVSPFDFVAAGRSARQRSVSDHNSDTGQTVYIGSPKSERRLKVYRYFEPHPRCKFLRVEVAMKDDLARAAATAVLTHGLAEAWKMSIAPYGLEHPLIFAARSDAKFERTLRKEPTAAGRLAWIHKQVVPALRDAIRSGLIDLEGLTDLLLAD